MKSSSSFGCLLGVLILFFFVFGVQHDLAILYYLLIMSMAIMMPLCGVIAIRELPEEIKNIKQCKNFSSFLLTGFIIIFLLNLIFVCLQIHYNPSSRFLVNILEFLNIFIHGSIIIVNIFQLIMNIFLLIKYHQRSLLYAIITQCLMISIIGIGLYNFDRVVE